MRREEQRLEAEKKESELRARNSIVRRDLDGAILARKTAQVRFKQKLHFESYIQCKCFDDGNCQDFREDCPSTALRVQKTQAKPVRML